MSAEDVIARAAFAWDDAMNEEQKPGEVPYLSTWIHDALLAVAPDAEGVAIMRDGTLRALRPARCFCAGVPAGTITDDTHWKMLPAPSRADERSEEGRRA